jgi:hypothetical protein
MDTVKSLQRVPLRGMIQIDRRTYRPDDRGNNPDTLPAVEPHCSLRSLGVVRQCMVSSKPQDAVAACRRTERFVHHARVCSRSTPASCHVFALSPASITAGTRSSFVHHATTPNAVPAH